MRDTKKLVEIQMLKKTTKIKPKQKYPQIFFIPLPTPQNMQLLSSKGGKESSPVFSVIMLVSKAIFCYKKSAFLNIIFMEKMICLRHLSSMTRKYMNL